MNKIQEGDILKSFLRIMGKALGIAVKVLASVLLFELISGFIDAFLEDENHSSTIDDYEIV